MQIEIYNPTQAQPLPPINWNYAEVKQWVEDGLAAYKGRVYTEDTVVQAKKDRANLNKLAEAIDGKRREMKALYLKPYEEFEAQAKELVAMIKAQSAEIDAQVKTYDEFRKQEKKGEIVKAYNTMIGDLAELVSYERLHEPKWLNVSTTLTTATTELAGKIDRIVSGLAAIDNLDIDPEIATQVKGVFLKNFDLAVALAEKERIEKQRNELNRLKAAKNGAEAVRNSTNEITRLETENAARVESTANPAISEGAAEKHTVVFKVKATAEQLSALKSFLKTNNIEYGRA